MVLWESHCGDLYFVFHLHFSSPSRQNSSFILILCIRNWVPVWIWCSWRSAYIIHPKVTHSKMLFKATWFSTYYYYYYLILSESQNWNCNPNVLQYNGRKFTFKQNFQKGEDIFTYWYVCCTQWLNSSCEVGSSMKHSSLCSFHLFSPPSLLLRILLCLGLI